MKSQINNFMYLFMNRLSKQIEFVKPGEIDYNKRQNLGIYLDTNPDVVKLEESIPQNELDKIKTKYLGYLNKKYNIQ